MRCFVTGSTGFIGQHLCERLRRDGHEVIALVRPGTDDAALRRLGVQPLPGTLESTNVFARHGESWDVVFHLAAITKATRKEEFYRTNARGTETLLQGLDRAGFQGRFLLVSSLAAGGPAEGRTHLRSERDLDRPVSLYGRSKRSSEAITKRLLPEGATYTILRPGAIYGPRERDLLEVFRLIKKHGVVIQFGEAVQLQMTHVADVVDAIARAPFAPATAGHTYYVTDRDTWTFEDVVTLVGECARRRARIIRLPRAVGRLAAAGFDAVNRVAGRTLFPFGTDKLREMEARFWQADSSRAEQDFGWRSRVPFPEGLRETVDWYRKNKWL